MKMDVQSQNFVSMTDEELVQFIIHNGNTSLFGILYDRYGQKVYQKCLGFAESRDAAEDLTQDVFVKLYLNLKSFRGEAKFSTWLYSFTYNHCVNYSKSILKRQRDNVELQEEAMYVSTADEEVTDEEIFSLTVEKLQEALGLIDPEDKIVLLMKYQDDKSIREIAQLLELGESAVKMRLHRAKKKIVELYNSLS
ncbi:MULTISPECIES: RNA polymerase sigma factor [Myroides]|jgi:RNA polymerase sigma-70 factor (ECF subfamily)|uniref:RNA polymerase sigma factor n=1 Tax=Myroides odoratus TaxID=256 RepID=A0A9Q6ZCG8_MYROD|nr:RNA polymerase sigma factor [Myroides odoratus]EHQ42754.1 RNA polymerase, sigma-24 subunit, ECF subfamily [Myroides odoratus DSM 2801]EKB07569.1 sigma-70 family RNA polymerase sigma factor [Myroides odoratus CIP 103059]MDR0223688.1 RNA polymerase sigma factor [Myroides odoratus]QQU00111.1 RNA polymerase sigma factor [Myroides odoratus]WQD57668.1 RNA polymerase sigma factor [Myroides odoratus]